MPLRIVLVRHGLSSFNIEHRIQGRDDLAALTAEGGEQARATGRALVDLAFDQAYTSPLRRAKDTATALLADQGQGLEAQLCDDLLEIDLEPWSGLLRSEVKERFPAQEAQWRQTPETMQLSRGDGSTYIPLQELFQQAEHFKQRLLVDQADALTAKTEKTVLVVGHNAILRCLILCLLGLPLTGFRRLRVDNCSISVLNLAPGADGGTAV